MKEAITPQGLRYALREGGTAVAWCALSVRCGTRDEGAFPEGIAHFLEHALFRGTRRKSAAVISGFLDRLGGELNAYTTKEEIVLHATVLAPDLWKAVRLLFELAFESVFPPREIETERGVVLDEIISGKDNPYDDVYDRFESLLFEGHPLGRLILGRRSTVRKITPGMLQEFVSTYFVPERMALSIVAPVGEDRMERKLMRMLPELIPAKEQSCCTVAQRSAVPLQPRPPFDLRMDKHHHEVNAVIGSTAPTLYDGADRITAALLANLLGGSASNSLLNREIREKRGWVYGIECSYTPYADSGVVAISFGCDRPNLEPCLERIGKILLSLREQPLSEARLKAAKRQTISQMAISSESGEAQCLSMGKSLLAWGQVLGEDRTRQAIEAVTPSALQQMACRLFDPSSLSRLIYL